MTILGFMGVATVKGDHRDGVVYRGAYENLCRAVERVAESDEFKDLDLVSRIIRAMDVDASSPLAESVDGYEEEED